MATPGSSVDSSEDDIDKGWDDVETAAPEPRPVVAPAPIAVAPPKAAPIAPKPVVAVAAEPQPVLPPSLARRPKHATKSKDERAAKAARKAAKQEARRAERKAASAQNQKRPVPRPASAAGSPVPSKASGAATRREADRSAKPSVVAMRTRSLLSHRRSLLVAGVVACLLLLGGLVWFLGWRNGSTLTLQ